MRALILCMLLAAPAADKKPAPAPPPAPKRPKMESPEQNPGHNYDGRPPRKGGR